VYFGDMKNYKFVLLLLILLNSCQHSQIEVGLKAKSGSNAAGFVLFSEKNGVVSLSATIRGLSKGTHAILLHEKADDDDEKSTVGNWGLNFDTQGAWVDQKGHYKGKVENFEVGENGIARIYFETDKWCIGCEDEKKDILGKAIIVHQVLDDIVSKPSNANGVRISCAGIVE
jgi:Cu-Zn family superoxide dismutase